MSDYDAENPTRFTDDECAAVVGKRATLALTGTIEDSGTGDAGPCVKFTVDSRWGFGEFTLVLDLDALTVAQDAA